MRPPYIDEVIRQIGQYETDLQLIAMGHRRVRHDGVDITEETIATVRAQLTEKRAIVAPYV